MARIRVDPKTAGIFLREVRDIIKKGDVKTVTRNIDAPSPNVGRHAPNRPSFGNRSSATNATRSNNFGNTARRTHGSPPADMPNPHGHHIVYRNGPAAARQYTRDSQSILAKYNIDMHGSENLVWAPNRGHTVDAARLLNQALREADATGNRDIVVQVLRSGGHHLFNAWP